MSARASTSAPQSGNVAGSGSRTSTCELRHTAQALPRHRLPTLRIRPPADAPPAAAARLPLLHRLTHDVYVPPIGHPGTRVFELGAGAHVYAPLAVSTRGASAP